jgi:hypothetical protein
MSMDLGTRADTELGEKLVTGSKEAYKISGSRAGSGTIPGNSEKGPLLGEMWCLDSNM